MKSCILAALIAVIASCTPAQQAKSEAEAKAVEQAVLTGAQKFCANKAFEAAIEALVPMSSQVEASVATLCEIDQTLLPEVHRIAMTKPADAGSGN